MDNYSSGEISVGMYKLKEALEKFYSDLLASHQRKCVCALAGMATWRFSSHRKMVKSLLIGIWYKHLHSVNHHDSCALGYGLVMFGWGIVVDNCDLGGVTYWLKGEVTYSLGKVVNFVIELISHSK
jgi:hypothetical protein